MGETTAGLRSGVLSKGIGTLPKGERCLSFGMFSLRGKGCLSTPFYYAYYMLGVVYAMYAYVIPPVLCMYTRVQYINHEKADIDAVFILAVNAIVDGYIWVVRIAPCSSVGRAIDCRGTDINRSLVRFQSGRYTFFTSS